jgi:glycosyltransferase involved in cell wall biosynthesis
MSELSLPKMFSPRLSAVVPVYNERGNLDMLIEELMREFRRLGSSFEIILVDDGSQDGSADILDRAASDRPELHVLHLERNAGQAAALAAGFGAARGEYLVTLDGDLQNDPADIARLLEWVPQYDMVVGIRSRRQDTPLRRLSSRVANRVRSAVLGDGIVDTGCSLKVFRRELALALPHFKGMHRFLPALAMLEGATVKQIPVRHRSRRAGTTKYNIRNRLGRGLADLAGVFWLQRRWARYRVSYEAPKPLSTPRGEHIEEEGR